MTATNKSKTHYQCLHNETCKQINKKQIYRTIIFFLKKNQNRNKNKTELWWSFGHHYQRLISDLQHTALPSALLLRLSLFTFSSSPVLSHLRCCLQQQLFHFAHSHNKPPSTAYLKSLVHHFTSIIAT